MPSLTTTVVAKNVTEVKLKPSLRTRLLKELKVYGALRMQKKVIESAMDSHKNVITELRDSTGEQSLSLDGYTTTLVAGIRKKFNPKKFVALGGDLAIYNQAVEDVPVKAYEKISTPEDRNGPTTPDED